MNDDTDTAGTRSRLFQLLALAFSHPLEDFHRLLADGSYRQALLQAATAAGCGGPDCPWTGQAFADLEADYIHLFQVGYRGRPLVALTAGDHEALAGEQGRPEYLLQYTAWYRHFGLQMGGDANELPDHLVCQLEFMAWLAHLEDRARDDFSLRTGYRQAQRDFLQRHLQPFLEVLVSRLQARAGEATAAGFYRALASAAMETSDQVLRQLVAGLPASGLAAEHETGRIDAVNLWG